MKRSLWQQPATSPGMKGPASSGVVLDALSRALDAPPGHDWQLSIQRQRLAGRSSIYVIRGQAPDGRSTRWVVKQPHTEWSQDDVGSPLTAREEFDALQRLDAHFTRLDVGCRVPAPVGYLPEIDALAMEYVPGPTVKDLLHYGSVRRPGLLLDGLTAAGTFLRHLHALEALPPVEVDLKAEAEEVLGVAEEKLRPLGLSLPDGVSRTLAEFPAVRVTSPQVWLHGDFGPANIVLAEDQSTVGLDAALQTVGYPEDDLVRFVVLVSGIIRLAPEVAIPPVARIRRQLESQLLHAYYQSPTRPLLFEVRYLHQLVRRWCRLRELAQQHERRALVRAKHAVIGRQMRLLTVETGRRLTKSLGS